MRRYTLLLVPLVLFLLMQSCAPAPVFRMKPVAKQTTFYEGTEYVHRYKNGIGLTISYDRHYGDVFAMTIKIVNRRDSVLRIRPSQFWYDAYIYFDYKYYDKNDAPDDSTILVKRQAINPDKKMLEIDLAISRSRAHQKTSNLLYGVGQALTIAGGIMSDSTSWQRMQTSNMLRNNAVSHRISNRNRALYRQSLRGQRRYWQLYTIRTTDLYPGEYIRGLVFFKNEPRAGSYMFHYRIGETIFNVFFIQKKYKP